MMMMMMNKLKRKNKHNIFVLLILQVFCVPLFGVRGPKVLIFK